MKQEIIKAIEKSFANKDPILYLQAYYMKEVPKEIGKLTHLKELYLDENQLKKIPREIGQLINLEVLSLGYNSLQSLPPELENLGQLRRLNLARNQLQQCPKWIGKLKKLRALDLPENQISHLPEEIGNLTELLSLGLCINLLSSFPLKICNLTKLESLDLSANRLSTIPREIGQLTRLYKLHLSNNQCTYLPSEIGNLKGLEELDLSHNQFSMLPSQIGNMEKLKTLYLSDNHLETLPEGIGNLSHLASLHADRNRIFNLPLQIGNLTSLESLTLAENHLHFLPQETGKLKALRYFELFQNLLVRLPPQIGNLKLTYLGLNDNKLETLPETIGQMETLKTLVVENNQLKSLPTTIGNCKSLKRLDLRVNSLDSLPISIGNLKNLEVLNARENKLTELPISIGSLEKLYSLDLSCNCLESLPAQIGDLKVLRSLHLDNNKLKSLPSQLGHLQNLATLTLQCNQLESLPVEIGQITNLDIELCDNPIKIGLGKKSLVEKLSDLILSEKKDIIDIKLYVVCFKEDLYSVYKAFQIYVGKFILHWCQKWHLSVKVFPKTYSDFMEKKTDDKDIYLFFLNKPLQKSPPRKIVYPVGVDFAKQKDFWNKVIEDIQNLISQIFQEHIQKLWTQCKTPWEREYQSQKAEMAILNGSFLGKGKSLEELFKFIAHTNQIACLYGEEKSGKSALLVKFYHILQKYENLDVCICFVGKSSLCSSLEQVLYALLYDLDPTCNSPKQLCSLENLKKVLCTRNRQLVILIDDLDRLREINQMLEILPHNVKLIYSSSTKNELDKNIFPLDVGQLHMRDIIKVFASYCFKNLSREEKKILFTAEREGLLSNPGFLHLVLAEINFFIFGDHSQLLQELPKTLENLLDRLLARLENYYSEELVEILFSLIYCSDKGLSKKELDKILAAIDEEQLFPSLLLHMHEYLFFQEGKYHLCKALEKNIYKKYLNSNKQIKMYQGMIKKALQ